MPTTTTTRDDTTPTTDDELRAIVARHATEASVSHAAGLTRALDTTRRLASALEGVLGYYCDENAPWADDEERHVVTEASDAQTAAAQLVATMNAQRDAHRRALADAVELVHDDDDRWHVAEPVSGREGWVVVRDANGLTVAEALVADAPKLAHAPAAFNLLRALSLVVTPASVGPSCYDALGGLLAAVEQSEGASAQHDTTHDELAPTSSHARAWLQYLDDDGQWSFPGEASACAFIDRAAAEHGRVNLTDTCPEYRDVADWRIVESVDMPGNRASYADEQRARAHRVAREELAS